MLPTPGVYSLARALSKCHENTQARGAVRVCKGKYQDIPVLVRTQEEKVGGNNFQE